MADLTAYHAHCARFRALNLGLGEVHHIIPRHAGGTDDPENLVTLPYWEHLDAHLLYARAVDTHKAWLAVEAMTKRNYARTREVVEAAAKEVAGELRIALARIDIRGANPYRIDCEVVELAKVFADVGRRDRAAHLAAIEATRAQIAFLRELLPVVDKSCAGRVAGYINQHEHQLDTLPVKGRVAAFAALPVIWPPSCRAGAPAPERPEVW